MCDTTKLLCLLWYILAIAQECDHLPLLENRQAVNEYLFMYMEKTFADGSETEKNAPSKVSDLRYTATFTLQVVETVGKCGIKVLGGND